MKKINLYIDGNYLIDLVETKKIPNQIDWNVFKTSILNNLVEKLNTSDGELLVEKASIFFTKNQKNKLGLEFISSIESANIDVFSNNDYDDFNLVSNALVWQISKNHIKDPYDICILVLNADYEFLLKKLKEEGIFTILISDLIQPIDYKLEPDLFINLDTINICSSLLEIFPVCPYCKDKIQKDDYMNHLLLHCNNKERIYSKTLKNNTNCCFCNLNFNANESKLFLEHLIKKHNLEFSSTIIEQKGIFKCLRCGSILSGCHPMVIIQHILQNCYK